MAPENIRSVVITAPGTSYAGKGAASMVSRGLGY